MTSQDANANNLASFFNETNLIEKFKKCYEEEIMHNLQFQEKLTQLSNLEYDSSQGSEFLIKKMIETNKDFQFTEMKEKLMVKFNMHLKKIMNIPVDDE